MVKGTGMSHNLTDYGFGELIEYNIQSFDEGLHNIMFKKEKWEEEKTIMQKLYNEKYSWKIMEKKLVSFYSTIIKYE
jgi:hypothetical protein